MPHLLIVDDEPEIRRLYAAELEDEGYTVTTAANPLQAVDHLRSESIDLMVLDIQLQGESGLQTLQNVVQEFPDLPVILCTAFSCYKDDFSSWLADGYVVKSSDLNELKSEINKVLARGKSSG
ncbi:MAG: two-component system response regulator [Desulfuromonas sp.]|nr:MAG: two-component system response regulator [Desulfuromonas sp.]